MMWAHRNRERDMYRVEGHRSGVHGELPDADIVRDEIAEVCGRFVEGPFSRRSGKNCYMWEYITGALKPEKGAHPQRGLDMLRVPTRFVRRRPI